MNFIHSCAAFGALISLAAGCSSYASTEQIPAVTPFDLPGYLGVWHEAARMPHRFERGMEFVTAKYTIRDDGRLCVRNSGWRNGTEHVATGIARQCKANTGELEVSFFRPFYGAYRIVALKSDGSAALVTSSTKEHAWILVRDPERAQAAVDEYVGLLRRWGYDTEKLEFPRMRH